MTWYHEPNHEISSIPRGNGSRGGSIHSNNFLSLPPPSQTVVFAVMVVSFLFNSMTSINILSMEYYRGPVRGFEVTFADLIAWGGLALGMLVRTPPSKIAWKPRFTIILFVFFAYAIVSLLRAGNSILGWFAIWQLARAGASTG